MKGKAIIRLLFFTDNPTSVQICCNHSYLQILDGINVVLTEGYQQERRKKITSNTWVKQGLYDHPCPYNVCRHKALLFLYRK